MKVQIRNSSKIYFCFERTFYVLEKPLLRWNGPSSFRSHGNQITSIIIFKMLLPAINFLWCQGFVVFDWTLFHYFFFELFEDGSSLHNRGKKVVQCRLHEPVLWMVEFVHHSCNLNYALGSRETFVIILFVRTLVILVSVQTVCKNNSILDGLVGTLPHIWKCGLENIRYLVTVRVSHFLLWKVATHIATRNYYLPWQESPNKITRPLLSVHVVLWCR